MTYHEERAEHHKLMHEHHAGMAAHHKMMAEQHMASIPKTAEGEDYGEQEERD